MTDIDTFRWGDTQTVLLLAAQEFGGETGTPLPSKQLMNAKWERPCIWRVMLSVQYNVAPVDVGLTFTVTIFLQVGLGQASQQVPIAAVNVVATSPATVIAPLFFDIPAETMQCQFFVGNFGNQPNAGDSVTVTAMCAPHTEPGSLAQMRDAAVPDRHAASQRDHGGMRWMPEGFDDGVMRYQY